MNALIYRNRHQEPLGLKIRCFPSKAKHESSENHQGSAILNTHLLTNPAGQGSELVFWPWPNLDAAGLRASADQQISGHARVFSPGNRSRCGRACSLGLESTWGASLQGIWGGFGFPTLSIPPSDSAHPTSPAPTTLTSRLRSSSRPIAAMKELDTRVQPPWAWANSCSPPGTRSPGWCAWGSASNWGRGSCGSPSHISPPSRGTLHSENRQ